MVRYLKGLDNMLNQEMNALEEEGVLLDEDIPYTPLGTVAV